MLDYDPAAQARAEALRARLTTGRSYLVPNHRDHDQPRVTYEETYARLRAAGLSTAASEATAALLVVAEQAGDKLTTMEHDALNMVRSACNEIANGRRS